MNIINGGGLTPGSRLQGQVRRDLGNLDAAPNKPGLWWRLRQTWKARKDLPMRAANLVLGRINGVALFESKMIGQVYRVDWSKLAPWQVLKLNALLRENHDIFDIQRNFGGLVTDYGVLSRKTVTDNGAGFIVDAFANSVEMESMKYHGLGTSSTAENQTHTALQTEITNTHYSGSARPAGTTEEGASANIYKTVGTHTQTTAGDTVTEHGILSASSAGVMFDRHIFTGVALAVSDSFVTTYQLTLTAGG